MMRNVSPARFACKFARAKPSRLSTAKNINMTSSDARIAASARRPALSRR